MVVGRLVDQGSGQRSGPADGGWAAGRRVRQEGVRNLAGWLVSQGLSRGNALWRSTDDGAGTDGEERTDAGEPR